PPLQAAPPWNGPRTDHVTADEERAVLREHLQSAGTTCLERLPHVGCFHEAEPGGHGIHTGKHFVDSHAPDRIHSGRIGEFYVQDDDALVYDAVVLDVADQGGRDKARMAREEHA